jgi:large subunit ribosomal protein L24
MSKWICKGDKVLVISGNDKGKVGEVLSIDEDRVVVQGVNIRRKHMKSRKEGQKSQISDIELSIHISNVMQCDNEGNRLKLMVRTQSDGTKKLIYFENDKEKTYRVIKKIKAK